MLPSILDWIRLSLKPHFHIGWNFFLALVPLILAIGLFRRVPHRKWLWWPGFVLFILFLPNAAYTLTDIVHFIAEVRSDEPELPPWTVVYIVIPKYTLFMFLGFQCHVISLILMGHYLTWTAHRRWILPLELVMNFLCSIGIYWGRYIRLNSWDILTKPESIAQQTLETVFRNEFAHKVIAVYFVVITAMYFVLKAVDLAVWEYWHRHRLAGRFPISPSA